MPLVASVLEPALDSLSAWAVYGVVWGFVFVESGLLVGFLLPGDSILFGAGLIAGTPGSDVDLALLATGAFVAAVAGDQVGFVMGRRLGRPYLDRRSKPSWQKHIRRTEEFYDRFGPLAVVVARFIPWVRTFTPFVAGVARMNYPRFLAANVVGALCWAVGLTVLGAWAATVPVVRTIAFAVAGLFIVASFVVIAVGLVRDRRSRRARPGGGRTATTSAPPAADQPFDGEPR